MSPIKFFRELTPEEEALIPIVRDEWLNPLFGPDGPAPLNKKKCKEGIEWLYELLNLEKPTISFLGSPMACQLAANEVAKIECRHHISNSYIIDNDRNMGIPVSSSISNDENMGISFEISTNVEIDEPIKWVVANSFFSLNHYIRTLIFNPIYNTVWRELKKKGLPMYEVSNNYCNWAYLGAEYDYWLRIGAIKSDGLKRHIEYLKSYPGYVIFLEGFAFVCGLPKEIHCDVEGRLHCETGPAVRWEDGYSQYYWHEISISSKWIDEPLSIRKEDFLSEDNAEKRRILHEILGTDRLMEILELETVDIKEVPFRTWDREAFLRACQAGELDEGMCNFTEDKILSEPEKIVPYYDLFVKNDIQTITLLKTVDNVDGNEKAQFIKVECPSTGEIFYLGVPNDFTDASEARAWTLYEDGVRENFET